MKIKLYKSFGEIEIETADDKDAIAQTSFWSELPNNCPKCNAELYLHYRETKDDGYKYYELHCRGEQPHYTQFGQYKTGGLFYKRDSWAERTFSSVQSESAAEINGHELRARIENAKKEIIKLGGKVSAQSQNESDAEYFESLSNQYRALNAR